MEGSGNPARVSHSKNGEELCDVLSGMTAVGKRAKDAVDVSGHWRVVTKARKQRVIQSGDSPRAKGLLLQYNVLAILLSCFI